IWTIPMTQPHTYRESQLPRTTAAWPRRRGLEQRRAYIPMQVGGNPICRMAPPSDQMCDVSGARQHGCLAVCLRRHSPDLDMDLRRASVGGAEVLRTAPRRFGEAIDVDGEVARIRSGARLAYGVGCVSRPELVDGWRRRNERFAVLAIGGVDNIDECR